MVMTPEELKKLEEEHKKREAEAKALAKEEEKKAKKEAEKARKEAEKKAQEEKAKEEAKAKGAGTQMSLFDMLGEQLIMAHKADYYLRLQVENENELVLVNEARWKNYSLDIYKYNITKNQAYMRANVKLNLGGWLVDFPGEVVKTWYFHDKVTVKTYPFEKITVKSVEEVFEYIKEKEKCEK